MTLGHRLGPGLMLGGNTAPLPGDIVPPVNVMIESIIEITWRLNRTVEGKSIGLSSFGELEPRTHESTYKSFGKNMSEMPCQS